MRLEYFQLIDRIIDIDIDGRKLRAEAIVPTTSTIFEGHFPSHPLMPGVLLLEAFELARRRRPDLTLARSLLGYSPTVAPDEGLRRTISHFRERLGL